MKGHGKPVLLMSYLKPSAKPWAGCAATRGGRRPGWPASSFPIYPSRKAAISNVRLGLEGLALVQMVTPVTPPDRLEMLCRDAQGFVYAVTMTGTTGSPQKPPKCRSRCWSTWTGSKRCSNIPVCAGFRHPFPRAGCALRPATWTAWVVGSALVEVLERGEDVGAFLRSLRRA